MQTNVSPVDPQTTSLGASSPKLAGKMPTIGQTFSVLGAAIGLGVGFAPIYFSTLAVFLKPLAGEFAWSRTETASAGTMSMLGLAVGAILVGRAIDRFGPARVISSSVALMAGLIALLPMSNTLWVFTAMSFLIGVAGAATTPIGYMSVMVLRFNRRLGLALGLAGVGMGVGTMSTPMIAQWLIAVYGCRGAYMTLALITAILGALACAMLFLPRGLPAASARDQMGEALKVVGETLPQGVRTRRFWIIAAVIFAVSASTLGMSVHLFSLITDRGVDAAAAARIHAVIGVGMIIGRLFSGALLDYYAAPRLAAITYLVASAGAMALAMGAASGFVALAVLAMMIGFAIGAEGDLIPMFVRRYFGLRAFGSFFGLVYFVFGVGALVGPAAFGASFDRTNSYSAALWATTVVLLCCAVVILQLGPHRYTSEIDHGSARHR